MYRFLVYTEVQLLGPQIFDHQVLCVNLVNLISISRLLCMCKAQLLSSDNVWACEEDIIVFKLYHKLDIHRGPLPIFYFKGPLPSFHFKPAIRFVFKHDSWVYLFCFSCICFFLIALRILSLDIPEIQSPGGGWECSEKNPAYHGINKGLSLLSH